MDSTTHSNMNFEGELLNLTKDIDLQMFIQFLEDSFYHSTDDQGSTLLHYSVQYKNVKVTMFLLEKGCDVNAQDKEGITLLMIAVRESREKMIEILLAAGADIFVLNNNRMSAFHMLSSQYKMNVNIIGQFLKKLKEKCSTLEEFVGKLIDNGYYLYQALFLKDYKIIEYMLTHGIPVDSVNPSNKITALHAAVLLDDLEGVNLLVKYGADVNSLNVQNENPLSYLYKKYPEHNDKKIEILKILLNQGASMTSFTSNSNIFQAFYTLTRGNRTAVRLLIESGLDFNITDNRWKTSVLHLIVMNSNAGVSEELKCCAKKLDINAIDNLGDSPLMVAVDCGNVEMVKWLLKLGARTNITHNRLGVPPLYFAYGNHRKPALAYKHRECGEMLLQYNADPQFVVKKNGATIFDAALKNNDAEGMKPVVAHLAMLEKLGVQITETTWEKINSHLLLKEYFRECQQILVQKISDHVILFNLLTSDGRKMARYLNNESIVDKLKNDNYKFILEKYEYYYNVLNRRYIKGKRFAKLRDKGARFICKIFQERIDKNHLIVENMIKYLDDDSLHQLNQSYRQSSCPRLFSISSDEE